MSAPPPSVVVNSPGALRIPTVVLNAYRNAERIMASAAPGCGVSWNLLAGIGRIESMHANGGYTDARGTAIRPILGPLLDGSLPGNEVIVQARTTNGVQFARALGPMQFLPGTWSRYASDGDGDGKADVQNVYDASLATARYLCSDGLNLRNQSQVLTAILRYNNSMPYAQNVLGWAASYATGVVPVDLPPITGPIPPMGDAHLEGNPEGLGPGMPVNAMGLSPTDPMALLAFGFGNTDFASQMPIPGGPLNPALTGAENPFQPPNCTFTCFGQDPALAGPQGSVAYLPGPAGYAPGYGYPGYGASLGPAAGNLPGPAPGYLPGPPPGYMPGPAPESIAAPSAGSAPEAVAPTQPPEAAQSLGPPAGPAQPSDAAGPTPLGPPPGPAN
jgi:hypothetical protein